MLYAMLFTTVYAENGLKKHITERNPLIKRLVNYEANGGYPPRKRSRRRLNKGLAGLSRKIAASQQPQQEPEKIIEKKEPKKAASPKTNPAVSLTSVSKNIIENGKYMTESDLFDSSDEEDLSAVPCIAEIMRQSKDVKWQKECENGFNWEYFDRKSYGGCLDASQRTNVDVTLNTLEALFYSVTDGEKTYKEANEVVPLDGKSVMLRTAIREEIGWKEMLKQIASKSTVECELGKGTSKTKYKLVNKPAGEQRFIKTFHGLAISIWEQLQTLREDRNTKVAEDSGEQQLDFEQECKTQIYDRFVDLIGKERENLQKCNANWEAFKKQIDPAILDAVEAKKKKIDDDNDNNMPKDANDLFNAVEIMRVLVEVLKDVKDNQPHYDEFIKEAKKEFAKYQPQFERDALVEILPTHWKTKSDMNKKQAGKLVDVTDIAHEWTVKVGSETIKVLEKDMKLKVPKVKQTGYDGLDGFKKLFEECDKLNPRDDEKCHSFKKEITEVFSKKLKEEPLFKNAKFIGVNNKGSTRAMYKLLYKYKGDANNLTDIMRASVILPSCAPVDGKYPIVEMVNRINDHFKQWNNGENGILRIKDRFNNPVNGYSDILLNVCYEGIICEIQVHLQPLFNIKNGLNLKGDGNLTVTVDTLWDNQKEKKLTVDLHKAYELSRRFTSYFMNICFKLGCYKNAKDQNVKVTYAGKKANKQ